MNSSIEIIQREEMIYGDGWRCEFKNEYKNKYMHHFDKKCQVPFTWIILLPAMGKVLLMELVGRQKVLHSKFT